MAIYEKAEENKPIKVIRKAPEGKFRVIERLKQWGSDETFVGDFSDIQIAKTTVTARESVDFEIEIYNDKGEIVLS